MAAYVIVSYDIDNPTDFAPYIPAVLPLLEKHGAEVLVADRDAHVLEGEKRSAYVVLRFASHEAALGFYNDPAYEPVKGIRLGSCSNTNLVVAGEFAPPEG